MKHIKSILFLAVMAIGMSLAHAQDAPFSTRQRNLITVSAYVGNGDFRNLPDAIVSSLDDGVTVNELKEAITALYAYTGLQRTRDVLDVLEKVLEQRKAKGIEDEDGPFGNRPENYEGIRNGIAIQTKLNGGTPMEYPFSLAMDYYLKAHLYGDSYSNELFSLADRELMVIAALCGQGKVGSELLWHVGHCANVGVTARQLQSLPTLLTDTVGRREGRLAAESIKRASR